MFSRYSKDLLIESRRETCYIVCEFEYNHNETVMTNSPSGDINTIFLFSPKIFNSKILLIMEQRQVGKLTR